MKGGSLDHVHRAAAARKGDHQIGPLLAQHLRVPHATRSLAVELPIRRVGDERDAAPKCPRPSKSVGAFGATLDDERDGAPGVNTVEHREEEAAIRILATAAHQDLHHTSPWVATY